jgi:hypothetical protein
MDSRAATEGGPYPSIRRGRPPWRPGRGKSQRQVGFFLPLAFQEIRDTTSEVTERGPHGRGCLPT